MVDQLWRSVMDLTIKNPYVLQRTAEERILPNFVEGNRCGLRVQLRRCARPGVPAPRVVWFESSGVHCMAQGKGDQTPKCGPHH